MIIYKIGVSINGIAPEIVAAITVANQVFEDQGYGTMVVTSVVDGKHSTVSLHYIGHAFDIRTEVAGIGTDAALEIARVLRARLTKEFDVVVEKNHIHVEFQPKR